MCFEFPLASNRHAPESFETLAKLRDGQEAIIEIEVIKIICTQSERLLAPFAVLYM